MNIYIIRNFVFYCSMSLCYVVNSSKVRVLPLSDGRKPNYYHRESCFKALNIPQDTSGNNMTINYCLKDNA